MDEKRPPPFFWILENGIIQRYEFIEVQLQFRGQDPLCGRGFIDRHCLSSAL